ncbi:hypothetical protein F383_25169 [Gossypium arboreum]|uniref:Uncharacterized protein n=1 Tax=Gossypium arboreum TaxID=29729 RepID=A0A0B0P8D9_GOSAR|nr:hypothetical protein F383_25169 [Gossypium arboreum]
MMERRRTTIDPVVDHAQEEYDERPEVCMARRSYSWAWSVARVEE